MLKLLFIVAAVVLLIWWLRRPRHNPSPAADPAGETTIVRCVHCGLHVPAEESVLDEQGRRYCCEDHRQRAGH